VHEIARGTKEISEILMQDVDGSKKGKMRPSSILRQNELISYVMAVLLLASIITLVAVTLGKKSLPVGVAYLLPIMSSFCGITLFSRRAFEMLVNAKTEIAIKGLFGTKGKLIVSKTENGESLREMAKALKAAFGMSVVGLVGLLFTFAIFTTFEIVASAVAVLLMYCSILVLRMQTSKIKPEVIHTIDASALSKAIDHNLTFALIFFLVVVAVLILAIFFFV